MFPNKRKTIGVFICRTSHHFQKILCRGITEQASKVGYNVAFFSSFGNYANNEAFCSGEEMISRLPDYEKLDGVILALDTIDISELKETLIKKCKQLNCPVVCIREEVDGLYNFTVDEENCMEGVIRHFVEEHKFRDICFLTGRKGDYSAESRLACFRRIMKEYRLPVDEKQIRYGNFWKFDGAPACRQFIDETRKIPEAIICANDYMAISVCNELIERGIRVPEDVSVCGYDGIWEAMVCASPITTVSVPFYQMGTEAVSLIHRINNGEVCEKRRIFEVNIIRNESCGCSSSTREEVLLNRKLFYDKADQMEMSNYQNTFMTIALEEVKNMEQLVSVIEHYIESTGDYRSFHMCLCEWKQGKEQAEAIKDFPETMHLYMTMNHGEKAKIMNKPFKKNKLLPDNIISDDPQFYFFLPLHFKERCFGYTAISFFNGESYKQNYHSWMVNLGNAIEDIHVRNKMQRLINHLEVMYVRDVLTGLFNRRGFEKFGSELLKDAKENGKYIYAVTMDLDKLKSINDKYGHSHGDLAIKMIGKAISYAAQNDEICARVGGDEFNILGVCSHNGQKHVDELFRLFNEKMKLINKEQSLDYLIEASYGASVAIPQENETLESYINKSDFAMYQMKSRKKGLAEKRNPLKFAEGKLRSASTDFPIN